jgi:hypothetical protein
LSILNFVVGWKYGMQYQGRSYVLGCLAISVAIVALLATLLFRNSDSPSVSNSAAFHFSLFAWLGTYAVPYLGETP